MPRDVAMSAFANLNGARIVSGAVTIPYYGTWVADVVLALSDVIPATSTLTVGNLSLVGTVYRMSSFSGSRSVRMAGGFGGWRKQLTARAYQNPGGVPLAMVLGDAASEVGEKITVAPSQQRNVGTDFVRFASPAERLLRQLAGPLWYVDPTGTTQVAATRAGDAITSGFQIIGWSGAKGKFSVATEDVASWMPGRTFTSPTVSVVETLSMVTINIENNGTLRLETLVTP